MISSHFMDETSEAQPRVVKSHSGIVGTRAQVSRLLGQGSFLSPHPPRLEHLKGTGQQPGGREAHAHSRTPAGSMAEGPWPSCA